jgi:hypothetical protein
VKHIYKDRNNKQTNWFLILTAVVTTELPGQADEDVDYLRYASDTVFNPTDTFKDIVVTIVNDDDCEIPADGAETFQITTDITPCLIVPATTAVSILPDDG